MQPSSRTPISADIGPTRVGSISAQPDTPTGPRQTNIARLLEDVPGTPASDDAQRADDAVAEAGAHRERLRALELLVAVTRQQLDAAEAVCQSYAGTEPPDKDASASSCSSVRPARGRASVPRTSTFQ